MKKTFFTIQIHSIVDLITNSSSELFVGTYDSKKIILNLIKEIYPCYLDEYEEIKSIDELSNDELDDYIQYNYMYNYKYFDFKFDKFVYQNTPPRIIPGFKPEEMFDDPEYNTVYVKSFFVKDNYDKIIKNIDPERKMFFLFSKSDNPNWNMQEKLSKIMTRFHLG